MIEIVEQAKQQNVNQAPLGSDEKAICFPSVNTCLTVTTVGKDGKLSGLHLGMYMAPEGNSTDSRQIGEKDVDGYLNALKKKLDESGGADRIYIAGCVNMWQGTMPGILDRIRSTATSWAKEAGGKLEASIQFDDSDPSNETVDIQVTQKGVKFISTKTKLEVPPET